MSEPTDLPTIDNPTIPLDALNDREKRIYAAMRWSGVVAIIEMRDGYDAAMEVVNEGPARFLPTEAEWEKINDTGRRGIDFVEGREM